jgi:nucleotide-binding universal stress UspA family protein
MGKLWPSRNNECISLEIERTYLFSRPMKNITVLVDYTEGCRKALNQTRILAELAGPSIHVLNVTLNEVSEAEHARLSAFATEELGFSLPVQTHIADGRLMTALKDSLEEMNSDLIVLCTHGVKGIAQHLFGSRILSLVQSVDKTFLVVQENTDIREEGFGKILFPATHSRVAEVMIRQVLSLAAECDSEVVFYEIDKYVGEAEQEIQQNFDAAKKAFKAKGIRFSQVKEEPNNYSMGFARQTLDYAAKNGISLIATPSEVMDNGFLMMKSDKELLLTNEQGIPILACG